MEQKRIAEARRVVADILDSLETRLEPISQILLKAKRLARLLGDSDAQTWLDFEMKGYPGQFEMAQVGYCGKYVTQGRFNADGSFKTSSLPGIEAEIQSYKTQIDALRLPSSISLPGIKPTGPFHLDAGQSLVGALNLSHTTLRDSLVDDVESFEAMKAGLHGYATDCQISLQFGDVVLGVFERSRASVDSFIRSACPKAAGQLLAVYERLVDGDAEARAQCLTSCRRVLLTVADSVFPARAEKYQDRTGTQRNVSQEDYKNRLLAFLDQQLTSNSSLSIVAGEIDHLAARLDAVYEKTSKGVHTDVSADEAELAVIHTYLFLAEVARIWPETPPTAANDGQ